MVSGLALVLENGRQPVAVAPAALAPAAPPGAESAGVGAPSATSPASDPPHHRRVPTDLGWAGVLGQLDTARTTAFGLGDVSLLSRVYADGSGPYERDATALLELAEAGVRAVGLRLVIDEVTQVRAEAELAVLQVVDRMPGYQLVRADGSVAEVRAGRGSATWVVTLSGGPGEWRIAAISVA